MISDRASAAVLMQWLAVRKNGKAGFDAELTSEPVHSYVPSLLSNTISATAEAASAYSGWQSNIDIARSGG